MEINYGVPNFIFAGDTVVFKISGEDYSAALYTYNLILLNTSNQVIITGTNDSGDHLVNIPSTTTANYVPGKYNWTSYFTDGTDRYRGQSGTLEIRPDYSVQTTGYDARSFAQKIVDALEAAITNRATNEQLTLISQSCTDLNVSFKADVYAEYQRWKELLKQELDAEKVASGRKIKRALYTRFS